MATLDPRIEDQIQQAIKAGNGHSQNLGLTPDQVNELFQDLKEKMDAMLGSGKRPILLVSPQIRRQVRNFIEPVLPEMAVLAYSELTPETQLESIGTVGVPNGN